MAARSRTRSIPAFALPRPHTRASSATTSPAIWSRATGAARRAARDDDLRAVGDGRALILARSREDVAGAGVLVAEGRGALAGVPGSDRRHRARARSADAPGAAVDRSAVPAELWTVAPGKDIRAPGASGSIRCCAGDRWPPPISRRVVQTPLLRAVRSARDLRANAGPWSAGTTLGWMLQAAAERHPPEHRRSSPAAGITRGGTGLVATSAGRDPHQRERGADRGDDAG